MIDAHGQLYNQVAELLHLLGELVPLLHSLVDLLCGPAQFGLVQPGVVISGGSAKNTSVYVRLYPG